MTNSPVKTIDFLRRHIWAIAAFIIPLTVRSIPEILSWPYPLGLDTLRYIIIIESKQSLTSPIDFLHNHLFYSIGTVTNAVLSNTILVIKIFGPLLLALLAFTMFLYARRALRWGNFKAFLVALLVGTYFVALRNSWDLYSQTLGLVFLFATLIVLASIKSTAKYPLAFIFMLLTVLSHELTSIILFFVLVFQFAGFLIKRRIKDSVYLAITGSLALSLFFFSHYSPTSPTLISIPLASTATEPSLGLAFLIGGLLVYCYALLIPLVVLGFNTLKDRNQVYWLILCTAIPLLTMIGPNSPLYYWNRWEYLIVYPLLFFAVSGLSRIWTICSDHKVKFKRLLPKVFAVSYLVMLLSLGTFYISANPYSQIPFFTSFNPYLAFIPSSMLQNTLPISDNPALVQSFQWLNTNAQPNSDIVMHYALCNLAYLYIKDKPLIGVDHHASMWIHLQNQTTIADCMVEAAQARLSNGSSAVYTVWWVSGKGWYDIPSLPQTFQEVYRVANFAVYQYSSDTS